MVTVVGAILTATQPHPDALGPPEPLWRVFGQGVVVNVLNPKCALYFLAFLPQFVDPSAGTAWSQVLVLGISFVVLGLLTNGLYALAGGAAGEWMGRRGSSAVRRAQRWVAGGVFLVLDVATAVSGSGKDCRPLRARPPPAATADPPAWGWALVMWCWSCRSSTWRYTRWMPLHYH